MKTLRTLTLGLALVFFFPSPAAADGPLHLDAVLDSVAEYYPLLQLVLEERSIADAQLLSKQGAFDLRLGGNSKLKPEGFYDTYQGDAYVRQPTTLWGTELFGGYRIGRGDFAAWDGGDQTNRGGEFRVGVKVPLFRNRQIDSRRAGLRKAEIDAAAADPFVREQLIEFTRAATFAYWEWVATGMRVVVARQLLVTAELRQSQIAKRIERGALPEIDLVDNERLIVDRQVREISTERAFQQAAIDLSLFLRDHEGNPVRALEKQVPVEFPSESRPQIETLDEEIERAFGQQPILREIAFKQEKIDVDLALAENRLQPEIALTIAGSNDVGAAVKDPDDKGPGVLEARIEFDLPVQRRGAKGEVAAARARKRQVDFELRFARDRIGARVRNAMTAWRAAFDQVDAAKRNRELSVQLQKAEERKLLLGTSNLINVNIRELQAFDAASTVIAAQADYFRAFANYQAALGDVRDGDLAAATPPANEGR